MKRLKISFKFFIYTILEGFVLGAIVNTAHATLMPILEVDSSLYAIADFDIVGLGNELRIDYFVRNISTFAEPGNAFENIEIYAGINQGVYDALVPTGWEAVFYEDKTRFHTGYNYIYPDEPEPTLFSLFYSNTELTIGLSQAMNPLGIWSDTVLVKIGNVPEPSVIILFSMGMLCLFAVI